jgi:hypothetical protein
MSQLLLAYSHSHYVQARRPRGLGYRYAKDLTLNPQAWSQLLHHSHSRHVQDGSPRGLDLRSPKESTGALGPRPWTQLLLGLQPQAIRSGDSRRALGPWSFAKDHTGDLGFLGRPAPLGLQYSHYVSWATMPRALQSPKSARQLTLRHEWLSGPGPQPPFRARQAAEAVPDLSQGPELIADVFTDPTATTTFRARQAAGIRCPKESARA